MDPIDGTVLTEDLKSLHQKGLQESYKIEGTIYDKFLQNQCPELMNIIKRDEIHSFVEFYSCHNLTKSTSAVLVLAFLHQSLKISQFLYSVGFRLTFDHPTMYQFLIYNQNTGYFKWYYEMAKEDINPVLSNPYFLTISGMSLNQSINQFLIERGVIQKKHYSHLFTAYGQSNNLDASKWLINKTEDKEDAKLILYYSALMKNKKNILKWVVENYQGDPIDFIRLNNHHKRIFNESDDLFIESEGKHIGLKHLIGFNCLEILKYLNPKLNLSIETQYISHIFDYSFIFKNLEVIKWIIEAENLDDDWGSLYLGQAVCLEWYPCVYYIWNHYPDITLPSINKYFKMVLMDGEVEFAKTLLISKQKDEIHVGGLDYLMAIGSSKLDMVEWFLEQFPRFATEQMYHVGIPSTMEITNYLINKIPNYKVTETSFRESCFNCDVNMLEHLMKYPLDFNAKNCVEEILYRVIKNGKFDNAKYLIESINNVNVRINGDEIYILACVENIDFAEYLLSKCPEMGCVDNANRALIEHCQSTNTTIENIRWLVNKQGANLRYQNDEPLFWAVLQNKPVLISYIMNKCPDTNFRMGDDKLFKYACNHDYTDVAIILDELCSDYHLEINNNEITTWYIKDFYTNQLEMVDKEYSQVLNNLNIKTETIDVDGEIVCMVCHDEHDKIIRLPCKHYVCLYALLKNYQTVKKFDGCFFCRQEYLLDQCVNVVKFKKEENEKKNSLKRKRNYRNIINEDEIANKKRK